MQPKTYQTRYLVNTCLNRHEQPRRKPGMQRHVEWFLYYRRVTVIYREKISLLFPFRRVIRSLLHCSWPLLACCLCWSHPAVRAPCYSCCSLSLLPTPELLENYLAKQHVDKKENPRISHPSQLKRNIPVLCSLVRKFNYLTLPHFRITVFNTSSR